MADDTVFFSRCLPQGADPIDLVVRERRIFIGWPAWRLGIEPRQGHLRECVIDLNCPDDEWNTHYQTFNPKDRKQYQQNRNFVATITPGAIVLVPRPRRGVVYAGRVIAPFQLLDDPPWGSAYLALRLQQGLDVEDELNYLADVAFCCEVDRFRTVPFPLIPAWIRRSLLGRSTYGRITSPFPDLSLEPYAVLDPLIDDPKRAEYAWTDDIGEVERRLVEAVGPNTFEHLCVALLQLENPSEVWVHVGGSGDGGLDGIGADEGGRAVGVLQCKWAYRGDEISLADSSNANTVRQVLAALLHAPSVEVGEGVEFWTRRHIASLIIRYAEKLPLALSLRVGHGP